MRTDDDDSDAESTENPEVNGAFPQPNPGLPTWFDMDDSSLDGDGDDMDDDFPPPATNNGTPPPNTELLRKFREYCEESELNLPLSKEDAASMKLMDILRLKKAPLNAYADVLTWHLHLIQHLREHETLKDTDDYFHRKTLMQRMTKRYNCQGLVPTVSKVKLPHSKAVVPVPIRQAGDCLVSLLTNPHVKDTDYLFWFDDPLARPPENVTYLADLNTGDAYLETCKKKILKPNQVALPMSVYIDGASTGQFSDLPVTAVKLALGIHKQSTRCQPWAWIELGWIPEVRKERARGKKIFKESNHLESQDVIVVDGEGDEAEEVSDSESEDEDGAVKAQDFHTILKEILKSFVELQKTGFVWDLVYKVHFLVALVGTSFQYVACGNLLFGSFYGGRPCVSVPYVGQSVPQH